MFKPGDLFVSPKGKDHWSGRLPAPNAEGTDGPLATIAAARDRIRRRLMPTGYNRTFGGAATWNEPITVWIRGGEYPVTSPIAFGPEDSAPVTYAAYPGEQPVFSGARRITGWQETVVNGRTAWVVDLPEVAQGKWYFRQLFVDGKLARRPRLPKQGLYRMAEVPGMRVPAGWGRGGFTQFVCRPGDVRAFHRLNDVEVVYVHFWIEERSPIAEFDPATNTVTMERPSQAPLVGAHGSQLADYYLDNVAEALEEPGEWYLDRGTGRLTYLPLPGQTIADTVIAAPCLLQFLQLVGDPEAGRFVEFLRFAGLTFAYTDWRHPDEAAPAAFRTTVPPGIFNRGHRAASAQAAADIPGVIYLTGARHCAFVDCRVHHVGWYGMEISDGCTGIQVIGCEFADLGAGGIKVNGADAAGPVARRSGHHRLSDNHIHHGGLVFHSAVGILAMHTFHNLIAHNHIHHLFYTGISCGWVWGYGDNVARENIIEKNYIHDIGQGLLSDMGGIYTLGIQPGTVIRGNLIHDVNKAHYGAWCIYPDEGSSHIIIEDNVCYSTNGQVFHQHYGRENLVRNNIFALGRDSQLAHGCVTPGHLAFTLMHNIIVTDGAPIFATGYNCRLNDRNWRSDANLFYDLSGREVKFQEGGRLYTLAEWQELGHDRRSLVADPGFADIARGDFTLPADSPAFAVGFRPIDLSDVGPRPPAAR